MPGEQDRVFVIESLGRAEIESPLKRHGWVCVRDAQWVAQSALLNVSNGVGSEEAGGESYEPAGPRERLFFDPAKMTCGIVTCGGLCPGLNDVIRSITLTLQWHYGVKRVLGFRFGYEGVSSQARAEPLALSEKVVDNIQHQGGTILGSSRGPQEPADMVAQLVAQQVDVLFVIGGDGTFRGAHALVEEIRRQGRAIGVVGVPKTIDNDICHTEMTFGYSTSIEEARRVISSAHMEAKGAFNGVGLVKLMGRDSGFIAVGASLASTDVNYCLIPEKPFRLEGEGGLLERLGRRLERKGHAVIVAAEGAGKGLNEDAPQQTDASGNVKPADIGPYLRDQIKAYGKERGFPISVKYLDPSYAIRSCPANARDSVFCLMLGQHAAHAGMAGKTDLFVGFCNQHFTHVPLGAAVGKRKKVDVDGPLWRALYATLDDSDMRTISNL